MHSPHLVAALAAAQNSDRIAHAAAENRARAALAARRDPHDSAARRRSRRIRAWLDDLRPSTRRPGAAGDGARAAA